MTHDVIVCVHDALLPTTQCIDSLLAESNVFDRLIVVDDHSDRPTAEMLAHRSKENDKIELVRLGQQHGYTRAANTGLRESTASIRTLLNSDTLVPSGWGRKTLELFHHHPYVGVAGPLSNAASYQSVPSIKGTSNQTAINDLPAGVQVDDLDDYCGMLSRQAITPLVPLVHGFCLSIRADVISEIGVFDEESFPVGYGEENDLCFRAEDAGFALAIDTRSYVYHHKSQSFQSGRRVELMAQGMKNLVKKHRERRVRDAVAFLEQNPILAQIRESVMLRFYNGDATT